MNSDQKMRWRDRLVLALRLAVLLSLLPVVLVVLLVVLAIILVRNALVLIAVWTLWSTRGKDTLVVYSQSPHWKEYFESGLLPKLERRAIALDWSERSRWPWFDLRVVLFRTFKGYKSFVPMILVVPPFRRPKTFRFYEAFQDSKHGKEQPLRELELQVSAYFASPSQQRSASE
jgi:hypothetical protein